MNSTGEQGPTIASKVLLLGAGFDTQNLGVEALAIGAIQILHTHFPGVSVELLEYGRTSLRYPVEINGNKIELNTLNIRFSKNLTLQNHVFFLILTAIMVRLFPFLRNHVRERNPYYRAIDDATAAFSIAGGDSFSDIYGLTRYFYVTLPQLLMLIMKKRLILLPQTFGPYKTWISRMVTRYVLSKAGSVHCRDHKSIACINKLFGPEMRNIGFCHDVAFGMKPDPLVDFNDPPGLQASPLVGLNVSGLLYFDRLNRFHLKCEYRPLIDRLLELFCMELGQRVLLMPHVITAEEGAESDVRANAALMKLHKARYGDRLVSADHITNATGAKAVIGRCDFFLGSRMHACIGALSQGIPAVGLAYSGKFDGLFATVGVESLALDMTQLAEPELIKGIQAVYEQRNRWRAVLKSELPKVTQTYERMAAAWGDGMVRAKVADSWPVSATVPKSSSR